MKDQYAPMKVSFLVAVLLFALSGVVSAQFTFTTNSGALTITGYTGPGSGAVITIPSETNGMPVICIGTLAFAGVGLSGVVIPNSITSIMYGAFDGCVGLRRVAIPDSVTNIGPIAFGYCPLMTNVVVGSGVTAIAGSAFFATTPTGIYFRGNAPSLGSGAFSVGNTTVYYLPLTTGWEPTFGGLPTVLWNPLAQTSDGGFGVQNNRFGFNITGSSNLLVIVEACTNLAKPTWTPVGTNTLNTFTGTNGTSHFSDPQWTNYPGRFYRLRSP